MSRLALPNTTYNMVSKVDIGDLVVFKEDTDMSSGIGLVLARRARSQIKEDLGDTTPIVEDDLYWADEIYPKDEPMLLVMWPGAHSSVNFWLPERDMRVVSKS